MNSKGDGDLNADEEGAAVSTPKSAGRQPLFLIAPNVGAVDLNDDESIDRWAEQVILQAFGVDRLAEDDEE